MLMLIANDWLGTSTIGVRLSSVAVFGGMLAVALIWSALLWALFERHTERQHSFLARVLFAHDKKSRPVHQEYLR
jgi:hypothetical protein